MRTVILDRTHPGYGGPQRDERLRRRLAGHLTARLREYEGEGIERVSMTGDGLVTAVIAGWPGAKAADALRARNVFCESDGEQVVFAIGAHTCFEELDYVQAAAAELL